jgi:pimeloyl-ACP methyl ester carboxylesterase
VTEADLDLGGGRVLHYYVTGPEAGTQDGGPGEHLPGREGTTGVSDSLVVFWHHGTPNIGAPPAPLFPASERLGIRWVSYDRPGYGRSTPQPGRDIASAAGCVGAVADELDISKFAVMGHSGGGTHALACAGLLPDRVVAAVSISGLAPFGADGLDWFAGMAPAGEASLRAATRGRADKERYEATAEFDPDIFTDADQAAFNGPWSWFGSVVGPAVEAGPAALIDDDMAYVSPWGFDPAQVTGPVLLMHGQRDRIVPSSHGEWLARHCPASELRLFPDDGHISVLNSAELALDWLAEHAR